MAKKQKKINMNRPAVKKKQGIVAKLAKDIKDAKVIGLIDIRALPDKQLQAIRKKLRGHATFAIVKNSLIRRSLEQAGKATELMDGVISPSALFISDYNPFKFYKFVKQNKGKAAAKPGQTAPFDIVVPAGETSLPPGPVLSELKTAGINVRLQAGKITIASDSVVAKKGDKISDPVAKALQKLGIEPIEVGMNVTKIWEDGVVYASDVLDVDETEFLADLRGAARNALNLSFNAAYPTNENISLLIGKAHRDAKGLAVSAEIYEKDIIDLILAKANAQASALKARVKE